MSNPKKHSKIDQLLRQADSAHDDDQYALAEALYLEATQLADESADWPMRARLHFFLADSRRMQTHYEAALTTYAWLMTLLNHPQAGPNLAGSDAVVYVYQAYTCFVEVGQFLPAMPSARLHQVLDEGEHFLDTIAHPEWAHSLWYQRGTLLKQEERFDEARQALERALALRRRNPDSTGYALASHLSGLAGVLVKMEAYEEAAQRYQEIWEAQESGAYSRYVAATGLARVALKRERWEEAEQWACEAVALAAPMDGPHIPFGAHEELVPSLLGQGKVEEAMREGVVLWYWGRRDDIASSYVTAMELCRVRLACARQVLGLPVLPERELPTPPSPVPPLLRQRAGRYLRAAERWVARAREPARQLDTQRGVDTWVNKVRELADRVVALRDWLASIP